MAKFELSISPDYLPGWGVWEGIREVVQNAIDEQTQNPEHRMAIEYQADSLRLVVSNVGAQLPIQALLIGKTSKADDSRTIGHFGEGLKLGAMALVRAGYHVSILNGEEIWLVGLTKSVTLDTKVLSFDIMKSSTNDGVSVIITGVQPSEWEQTRRKFLVLNEPKNATAENLEGRVLFDSEHRGLVYVKGVLVCENDKMKYGYDLLRVPTNRDRSMVDVSDRANAISKLWRSAMLEDHLSREKRCINDEVVGKLMDLLLDYDAADLTGLFGYASGLTFCEGDEDSEVMVKEFQRRHGEKSFPVGSDSEAKSLEHFGMTGVVVPRPMLCIFSGFFGKIQDRLQELISTPKRIYLDDELSPSESANLAWAMNTLLAADDSIDFDKTIKLEVVDFGDDELLGLFESHAVESAEYFFRKHRIRLAKSNLRSKFVTLEVLLHEVCHRYGQDGSKDHVSAIESTWRKVCTRLAEGVTQAPASIAA